MRMHIAPNADIGFLFLEISLVFLDKEEAIPELSIASLVGARREVLRHEWRIDADEMRAFQRSADRKVSFGAAAELWIEAA